MITLKNIADLIIHDLSNGVASKDSTYDARDIIMKARVFLNAVLKPVAYFDKWNSGDKSAVTQAIYSYELTVDKDAVGQMYVTIPDFYAVLPNNRGVHRIYIKGNPYADFIPQSNPGISGDLPHTKIKGLQYCYTEGRTTRFPKDCNVKKGDKVILQIINSAPDAVGENDALPATHEQISEVLRMLKADLLPVAQIPADNLNNGNTNIR
jgi:hypothetical protein